MGIIFLTHIVVAYLFRPCAEGAVRCITRLGGFECVCRYGYVGEFCQDQDSDPPFTGVTSSTANMTTVAMTTRGVPVQSSPEATDTNMSLYTTVNSTSKSVMMRVLLVLLDAVKPTGLQVQSVVVVVNIFNRSRSRCNTLAACECDWLVAWLSCRTSVFDRRTYPLPCSTHNWRVTTCVGIPFTIGPPTRPTQLFILSWSINE